MRGGGRGGGGGGGGGGGLGRGQPRGLHAGAPDGGGGARRAHGLRSLHGAGLLPRHRRRRRPGDGGRRPREIVGAEAGLFSRRRLRDRKSTRLNSSHQIISYAVFCLKKKKK